MHEGFRHGCIQGLTKAVSSEAPASALLVSALPGITATSASKSAHHNPTCRNTNSAISVGLPWGRLPQAALSHWHSLLMVGVGSMAAPPWEEFPQKNQKKWVGGEPAPGVRLGKSHGAENF